MGTTKLVKRAELVRQEHFPWLYKGLPLDEIPLGAHGFIYKITYTGNNPLAQGQQVYLGQKTFVLKKSRRAPATQQFNKDGSPKKYPIRIRKLDSESWKKYVGSNKILQQLFKLEPPELFRREVLAFAPNKRWLTYLEAKYLFCEGVLESTIYFNRNIGGSFYAAHLYPAPKNR